MSLSNKHKCREIITKAICGKGRKFSTVTHTVTPPNNPTSILGAWIIKHEYEAVAAGDAVEVVGTYELNIWFSHDKNSQTDVAKETVSYVERVPLSYLDPKHRAVTVEVTAEATQEPSCVEASVSSNGKSVILRVEREFAVELVAETKVLVKVCDYDHGDYEDKEFEFVGGEEGEFEDLDYEDLEDDL